MSALVNLSKQATQLLRHKLKNFSKDELHFDDEGKNDGYVTVKSLLNKINKGKSKDKCITEDKLEEAVNSDQKKKRMEFKEFDNVRYIRAKQGHSQGNEIESKTAFKEITLDDLKNNIDPIWTHGTYLNVLPLIMKEGLSKMQRQHVHFGSGIPSIVHQRLIKHKKLDEFLQGTGTDSVKLNESGMRSDATCIIVLDLEKALNDKMKFYLSANNVLLTEGFDGYVSSKYFKYVFKFE